MRKSRTKRPIFDRFYEKVQKTKTCWLWVGAKTSRGYGSFWDGKTRQRAHRWIYQKTKGTIPKDYFICHSCDAPSCVNPKHLWAGTQSENIKDCCSKGRNNFQRYPELIHSARSFIKRQPRSKITEAIVSEIRTKRSKGKTCLALAKEYGLSVTTIKDAACGYTWTHVKTPTVHGRVNYKGCKIRIQSYERGDDANS